MQESVKNGGPFYAILGFIVLPLIWSVPEALVTAELATAFPENSGYVVWVGTAFGPFFGFMEGLFSWVSGVTDNTIYPVVFLSYLKLFVPALQDWWTNRCESEPLGTLMCNQRVLHRACCLQSTTLV